jgi:hypothetical protein
MYLEINAVEYIDEHIIGILLGFRDRMSWWHLSFQEDFWSLMFRSMRLIISKWRHSKCFLRFFSSGPECAQSIKARHQSI